MKELTDLENLFKYKPEIGDLVRVEFENIAGGKEVLNGVYQGSFLKGQYVKRIFTPYMGGVDIFLGAIIRIKPLVFIPW